MKGAYQINFPQTWVDDYLDLYNYALRLGDLEWQRDIIRLLKEKDAIIQEELHRMMAEELWRLFDQINGKMLQIFEELRHTDSAKRTEELRERAWELKVQRNAVTKKIRAISR